MKGYTYSIGRILRAAEQADERAKRKESRERVHKRRASSALDGETIELASTLARLAREDVKHERWKARSLRETAARLMTLVADKPS